MKLGRRFSSRSSTGLWLVFMMLLTWGNIKNKLTVSQSANAGRLLEFPRRANGTPSPQSMMAKKKPSAMLEEMIHWTITILSSSHFKMFACCIGGWNHYYHHHVLFSNCFLLGMLDVYHGAARIDQLRPLLTRQGFFERLLKGEVWYVDGKMLWRRFGCTSMTITRIWCHRGARKSATGMLVTKKINHSAFACNRFWFEEHCSICNWCIPYNSLRGNKEVMVFLLLNMGTVQPGLPTCKHWGYVQAISSHPFAADLPSMMVSQQNVAADGFSTYFLGLHVYLGEPWFATGHVFILHQLILYRMLANFSMWTSKFTKTAALWDILLRLCSSRCLCSRGRGGHGRPWPKVIWVDWFPRGWNWISNFSSFFPFGGGISIDPGMSEIQVSISSWFTPQWNCRVCSLNVIFLGVSLIFPEKVLQVPSRGLPVRMPIMLTRNYRMR